MQQGSAKWYRYWMRRWGKQLRKDAPRYHRPSLRGTAADGYERPWWMKRSEPYEYLSTVYERVLRGEE